jgi:hypothetical protein
MTTTVVPFGKYKGQPVEALAQDRAATGATNRTRTHANSSTSCPS